MHGGDRLPWVAAEGVDNHAAIADLQWQAHIYGGPGLADGCAKRGLPRKVFPWTPQHARPGLEQNALYLVQADGYVALADEPGSADSLERYFVARSLST